MNRNRYPLAVLILLSLFFMLPILANPTFFLNRGNDLTEFFFPLIHYVKESILTKNTVPLWNPLWFNGMPLIADPQSPYLYPLNVIFLFVPIQTGFILGIWLHIFLALYFFYRLCMELSYKKMLSVGLSSLYILIPHFSAILEAGHWGLIIAWAWIPAAVYYAIKIVSVRKRSNVCFFAISLACLYVAHSITAIILSAGIILFLLSQVKLKKSYVITLFSFLISGFLFIGLVAPALFPQLLWQQETTRSLLLTKPELYPQWTSKREFLGSLVKLPGHYDTEKIITLGLFPLLVGGVGFLTLKRKAKILIGITLAIITLISLNNVSPISEFLKIFPFFQLMRVTTRVWILIYVPFLLIVGNFLNKIHTKKWSWFILVLLLANLGRINLTILSQQPSRSLEVGSTIYKYLSDDHSQFRVYCPSRCFSQKHVAELGIQTIDGYATLIPKRFYIKSWGLFGGYWDYYTLSLPPFGASLFQNLKPDFKELGEANTKYIVSDVPLKSAEAEFLITDGYFNLYRNKLAAGEAYVLDKSDNVIENLIVEDNLNSFKIYNNNPNPSRIIITRTFSPGWEATNEDGIKISIQESPSALMSLDIPENTSNVIVTYNPPGFRVGMILFVIASVAVIILLL